MKCTDAFSGAFAGAGTVRNVQCAVCRVQCAASMSNTKDMSVLEREKRA